MQPRYDGQVTCQREHCKYRSSFCSFLSEHLASKINIFYDKLGELMKISTDSSFLLSVEQYETLLQETKQKHEKQTSTNLYQQISIVVLNDVILKID